MPLVVCFIMCTFMCECMCACVGNYYSVIVFLIHYMHILNIMFNLFKRVYMSRNTLKSFQLD